MTEETRESSFDELARGMASGILSRGKALRWLGAALLGGALAPSHRRWQRQRTSLIDAIAGPGLPLSVLVLHEATVPHVSEAGRRILTRLAGGASGKIHCNNNRGPGAGVLALLIALIHRSA